MDHDQPKCPYLPLEVWTRIMGYITDCRYLPRVWLNCRRVSHVLKAATETAFIAKHLPHTYIEFDTMGFVWNEGSNTDGYQRISVEFNHLAENGDRAVFVREHNYDKGRLLRLSNGELLFEKNIRIWRQTMSGYLDDPTYHINTPRHMLYVRREVNDTVLPGLQIDFDNIEVSLLWKPMLSMVYGEAEYIKWAEKVQSQNSGLQSRGRDLAAQVHAGEIPVDEFLGSATTEVSKKLDIVHAEVRRLRFVRWHEKYGSPDDPDVTQLLRQPVKQKPVYHPEVEHPDVLSAANAMELATFYDEYENGRKEKGKGNFYDGLGYKFMGNAEKEHTGDSSSDDEDSNDKILDDEVPDSEIPEEEISN